MTNDDWRASIARTDERVAKALEMQAAHEARCDKRYSDLERAIEKLSNRWIVSGVAVMLGLISLLGYLIVHGRPWG